MAREDDRERTRSRLGALARAYEPPSDDDPDRARPRDGDVHDHEYEPDAGLAAMAGGSDDSSAGADAPPSWLVELPPGPARRLIPASLSGARIGLSRGGIAALLLVGLFAAAGAGVFAVRERPVAQPVPALAPAGVEAAALSHAAAPVEVAAPGGTAPPRGTSANPAAAPGADGELVVSVVGLVHVNGLVRLPAGSRIADAIAAAGGAKEGADLLSLNMAARVADGDQILVGVADPNGGAPVLGSAAIGPGRGSAAGAGGTAPQGSTGKVNLNTATEAQLDELPGVGPVTAAAIVGWRNANGPFSDVEQLGEVDGIGPARLAKLRDLVAV
ncbi:ComEA family DNA-binding protein [Aldersonia sp. NBC_00410]|uniref:ComEA family DNA-binding protein n=1 Tax=Aldersonia sp. NBC_00410 TaxID=2975954 RepID=UPI0022510E6B|nr:ComEA family DNA-binding protein [Aldersonia sp. NBC_00410]MCX5042761.1 ComEA family DNA-binding protein [Aldersonia sp. NBC_00410]